MSLVSAERCVCVHIIGHCQLAKTICFSGSYSASCHWTSIFLLAVSAFHPQLSRAHTPTTMPKRRRDENEEAESSPLADDALEAKILELVRKRGLTKTC